MFKGSFERPRRTPAGRRTGGVGPQAEGSCGRVPLDTLESGNYPRPMIPLTYRARALGPLCAIDWTIPGGVSVVVGPNRVGKSTLLRLPELLRAAAFGPLTDAFTATFGGLAHMKNITTPSSTPMAIGMAVGTEHGLVEWGIEVAVRGGTLAPYPAEYLAMNGARVIERHAGGALVKIGDHTVDLGRISPLTSLATTLIGNLADALELPQLRPDMAPQELIKALKRYLPAELPDEGVVASVLSLPLLTKSVWVRSYRTYDYQINHLLIYGSRDSPSRALEPTGENVFSLLRNWRDSAADEERFNFVVETMRSIFPHLRRISFERAGQTVTMYTSDHRWPSDSTLPIDRESTGFITALLQLCAIASGDRGGLVTLDEVETSLHPRAIQLLIEAARRWAAGHDLRVVLATQSETVLDQFRDDPSRVFVLEAGQETSPRALTDIFSPEYLGQFSLGDLFAHLEFGGDLGDVPAAP